MLLSVHSGATGQAVAVHEDNNFWSSLYSRVNFCGSYIKNTTVHTSSAHSFLFVSATPLPPFFYFCPLRTLMLLGHAGAGPISHYCCFGQASSLSWLTMYHHTRNWFSQVSMWCHLVYSFQTCCLCRCPISYGSGCTRLWPNEHEVHCELSISQTTAHCYAELLLQNSFMIEFGEETILILPASGDKCVRLSVSFYLGCGKYALLLHFGVHLNVFGSFST